MFGERLNLKNITVSFDWWNHVGVEAWGWCVWSEGFIGEEGMVHSFRKMCECWDKHTRYVRIWVRPLFFRVVVFWCSSPFLCILCVTALPLELYKGTYKDGMRNGKGTANIITWPEVPEKRIAATKLSHFWTWCNMISLWCHCETKVSFDDSQQIFICQHFCSSCRCDCHGAILYISCHFFSFATFTLIYYLFTLYYYFSPPFLFAMPLCRPSQQHIYY